MRSFLSIAAIALALAFSGLSASAAPVGKIAPPNDKWAIGLAAAPASQALVAEQNEKSPDISFVAAAGTIVVLAGAGLIGTLAAVGLTRVWTEDPILYPCKDGP
jgi:hypothetical protein